MTNLVAFRPRSAWESPEVELIDHSHAALVGATLRWKRYRSWSVSWLTGRCELCGAGFTEGGSPGLNSGYAVVGGGPAGQDDYLWICAVCYDTSRDRCCWTVLDTRGKPTVPPDIVAATFELVAWPAENDLAEGDSEGFDPDAWAAGAPPTRPR